MSTIVPTDAIVAACSSTTTYSIGDERAVSVIAISRAISPALDAAGYRYYYDDREDTTHYFRITDGIPVRVPIRDFRERIARVLSVTLAIVEQAGDWRGAARAKATRRAIDTRSRGWHSYVCSVVESLSLPDLSEASYSAAIEAARATCSPGERTSRREYESTRRAARDEDAIEQTRTLLADWAPNLGPGRHYLGDVWNAWDSTVLRAPSTKEHTPAVLRVGRNKVYALLTESFDVVAGGAHRRYLVLS